MHFAAQLWQAVVSHLHAGIVALLLLGSVDTGADVPHDWFGGALTEMAPSNIPSGGSPKNLNVEFLPGLVRTRGGLQPRRSYASISGGPWQIRWVDDYATAPEQPTEMVLLVNPNNPSTGAVAVTVDDGFIATQRQIGSVYGYGSTNIWWAPGMLQSQSAFTGPLARGCTQFGRKYIAISEGRYGYDLPRQWDGTNYDRVSQCGPGIPPIVQDATGDLLAGCTVEAQSISAAPIFETGNTVYVEAALLGIDDFVNLVQAGDTISIPTSTVAAYEGQFTVQAVQGPYLVFYHPQSGLADGTATVNLPVAKLYAKGGNIGAIAAGSEITITAGTPAGWDGTWPVRDATYYPNDTPPDVYAFLAVPGAWSLANGTCSIVNPGTIPAGYHGMAVAFITRTGYITRPSPPVYWKAGGSLQAEILDIPIGPANVVGRLLLFTQYLTPPLTSGGTFYSIRKAVTLGGVTYDTAMQIDDNTTVSGIFNFNDSDLAAGFNGEYLFNLIELGECAGCFSYAGRMFWWGELNAMQDFLNLSFNGGWSQGVDALKNPFGWANDPTYGAGAIGVRNGGVWLDAWRITGTGDLVNPIGMITQSGYQNYLKNALLAGATAYGARCTYKYNTPTSASTAQLVLEIFSPTAGSIGKFPFSCSNVTGLPFATEASQAAVTMPATVPSDTEIRLYAVGLASGETFTVDRIALFPANEPVNYSVLRASYASDPESFDGTTGLIQPTFACGQAVRAVYTLRDSMYIECDRSGFVTKDVAGQEPANWSVDVVSSAIGVTGPNAASAGEDWEVKVNRYGLYLYIGREPEKISQEIQSLWNKEGLTNIINWAAGYKIWATVDLLNKRVYVGAPVGAGATECNTLFVMDYNTLDTSEMIAEYPTLRFSPYTGRPMVLPQGRKWTQWTFASTTGSGNMAVPCGAFVERYDGTAQFVLGGGADNNLYFIDPTERGNDNGVACASYYSTHFFPTSDEEQALQLRSQMHGFSFGRMYVQGAGKLQVTAYHNTLSDPNPRLASVDLSNPALQDAEETFDDFTAERFALLWECNTLGSWFQMERLTRTLEQDPNGLIRGSNLQ